MCTRVQWPKASKPYSKKVWQISAEVDIVCSGRDVKVALISNRLQSNSPNSPRPSKHQDQKTIHHGISPEAQWFLPFGTFWPIWKFWVFLDNLRLDKPLWTLFNSQQNVLSDIWFCNAVLIVSTWRVSWWLNSTWLVIEDDVIILISMTKSHCDCEKHCFPWKLHHHHHHLQ